MAEDSKTAASVKIRALQRNFMLGAYRKLATLSRGFVFAPMERCTGREFLGTNVTALGPFGLDWTVQYLDCYIFWY